MAIEFQIFFIVDSVIAISLLLGWLISGKPRIYIDMSLILFTSLTMIFLSFVIFETNKSLGYIGILFAALLNVFIGLRVRQTYTNPIIKMNSALSQMNLTHDFSNTINLTFATGYDSMKSLFDTVQETIFIMLGIIKQLSNYENQTDSVSESVKSLTNQLNEDTTQLIDDIDENLQSAVMGNEASEKIQNIIQDLSMEFSKYNQRLNKEIASTDNLSDQTNLVAVNAAIEAAHSNEEGENFAIVADGIQKLSSRSRNTAGNLSRISIELNKMITEKVNEISHEFTNLDNIIYQIADLSDKVSNISHNQKNINDELNRQLLLLSQKKSKLEELRENFKH